MACEQLKSELAGLIEERTALQDELKTAPPALKPFLVSQIKALNKQIALKKHELDVCTSQNPSPPPLNTSFSGTFTIMIHKSGVPPSITGDFSAAVVFNPLHTSFTVTSLAPLSATFDTPIGSNTTTVSLDNPAPGSLDKSTGNIVLLLPLFFDQSIDIPFYEEDSRLTVPLGTGTAAGLVGSPLDASGAATLVGSAGFQGGYLAQALADVIITGTFADIP